MAITTTFLIVLIVSLVIGNALLFLFKKPEAEYEDIEEPIAVPEGIESTGTKNLLPLEKKIDLAHNRIQSLESKASGASLKDFKLLKYRVEKIDDFCSTAEAEIIGLKDILEELQNNHVTIKSRSFRNSHKLKEKGLNPKELHNLVFRSTK